MHGSSLSVCASVYRCICVDRKLTWNKNKSPYTTFINTFFRNMKLKLFGE